MTCPACTAAGVATCDAGETPTHISVLVEELVADLRKREDGDGCRAAAEGVARGKIGAQVKTAPGGALTPESQGLADYQGVD